MKTSENIVLSEEGKYCWTYSLSLYKYPKILFILLKVFGWLFLLLCLLLLFINAQTCDIEPTPPQETILMCVLLYAFCAFVMTILYYLVTLARGGKKYFSYEMDGEGIARVKGDVRLYTGFADIKKVKTKKRRCEITLKARGSCKKVYVFKEDYDEVLGYIKEKAGK